MTTIGQLSSSLGTETINECDILLKHAIHIDSEVNIDQPEIYYVNVSDLNGETIHLLEEPSRDSTTNYDCRSYQLPSIELLFKNVITSKGLPIISEFNQQSNRFCGWSDVVDRGAFHQHRHEQQQLQHQQPQSHVCFAEQFADHYSHAHSDIRSGSVHSECSGSDKLTVINPSCAVHLPLNDLGDLKEPLTSHRPVTIIEDCLPISSSISFSSSESSGIPVSGQSNIRITGSFNHQRQNQYNSNHHQSNHFSNHVNNSISPEVLTKIENRLPSTKPRAKLWKKYSKKKHLTQDELERKRDLANQQERTRMHRLNSALKHLRNAIPYEFSRHPPEKNLSKIKTLRIAIEYIRELTHILNNNKRC